MSLDPTYLDYPRRRHGYDHDLYPWSAIGDRAPIAWPGGKSVAVWFCVSLEWFPILPSDTPFRAPGHMVTPYPDYRHYTARDYGSRVGVWRMLDAFAAAGVRASFATNAAIAERYPELMRAILNAGHEVVAHSTDMNGTIASTLPEEQERALIAAAIGRMHAAAGVQPAGWLSVARSQSWNTNRLLAEAGLTYMCDWVNDELPYRFANGIVNLPLNHELSDRQIVAVQQQSSESWAEQLCDAFDWLTGEAREHGGRMLPIHVTPYIMGLPYRIGAFEALVANLASCAEAWVATGSEIVDAWATQT
jgi:peptidoglycan/xylan/chitin deacetylase (PgdA/CDA1 family)